MVWQEFMFADALYPRDKVLYVVIKGAIARGVGYTTGNAIMRFMK